MSRSNMETPQETRLGQLELMPELISRDLNADVEITILCLVAQRLTARSAFLYRKSTTLSSRFSKGFISEGIYLTRASLCS